MPQNQATAQDSNLQNDKQPKLFSKRRKIYPRRVKGRFRNLKWLAMLVTLAIYYLAPFIRWDRGENAPDQAILIDLPSRRAYWFFIEIWPQEVYYLTAILVFSAILLFLVTSAFGRVWCGYFCPQTVWTDLYMLVERLIQGDSAARQRLDRSKLSFEKIWKKSLTHIIWIFIALCTGGAFVFYFNDAPMLWGDILRGEISTTVLAFVSGLTFSTYLMAGFAREQVCTYMCPYARFQAAMFDKDTLIIGYDADRGEPRGHHKKGHGWEGRGHCIDCTACVQVCPTGIDIRRGLQMECIACGLCIDACDDIMHKVGLPPGLIRYDTENNILRRHTGSPEKIKFMRPRTMYYAGILAIVAALVLYGLITRTAFEMHVIHDRNPLYVTLSDGSIRNGYEIKILNKTHEDRTFALSVSGISEAKIVSRNANHLDLGRIEVQADSVDHFHIFMSATEQENAKTPVDFRLRDLVTNEEYDYEGFFVSRRGEN